MHLRCRDAAYRAEREEMRVRNVMTRSGRNYRSYYPSKKLCRMVHCESILERKAAHLFENSMLVLSYQEQPEIVNYADVDEIKTYFPDFHLRLENCDVFIEVKPISQLTKPEVNKKFNAIRSHFYQKHMNFYILDDKLINGPNAQQQFDSAISNFFK
jgi:hypothetical protein